MAAQLIFELNYGLFPSLKARPGKSYIGQDRGRAFLRGIDHVRYRRLYLRLAGDKRGFPHLSIPFP
jgi:hypothetical protein